MQPKPNVILRRTGPNSAAVEYKTPAELAKARVEEGPPLTVNEFELRLGHEGDPIPPNWVKGQLLNVRNRGDYYVITLYPEEEDPRHPERALRFSNTWTCQEFVSKWYALESADPRAR